MDRKKPIEAFDFYSNTGFDDVKMWFVVGFIAFLAFNTRAYFGMHTRWWMFGLASHGIIYAYTRSSCDEVHKTFRVPRPFHDAFCCTECGIEGGWKYGQTKRIILMLMALIAIGINVVPKYWRGDEALRHMVHVKKATIVNPLFFHIIARIATVVVSGSLSLAPVSFQINPLLIGLLWVSDIAHQISIHRLLANHDGIWSLRCVNMALAIMKWIVLLRVNDPQTQIDMIFFQSCGFLGAQVFMSLVYIAMYFGVRTRLVHEDDWYSLGACFAQFWIFARFWSVAGPVLWISFIACSTMYYHQLWRDYLDWRPFFIAVNCVMTMLCLTTPLAQSLTLTALYTHAFLLLPGFKRQPIETHTIKSPEKKRTQKTRSRASIHDPTPRPTSRDAGLKQKTRSRASTHDPTPRPTSRDAGLKSINSTRYQFQKSRVNPYIQRVDSDSPKLNPVKYIQRVDSDSPKLNPIKLN